MSAKLRSMIALSCLVPVGAMADAPTVYGRINLTAQQNSIEKLDFVPASGANPDKINKTDITTTTLESNASRIGFKGSEKFSDLGISGFYLAEYEIFADDDLDGEQTFKPRNVFLGLKGDFGSAQAGFFDTPLKSAQNKVDLFNDMQGDINKYLTVDDFRRKNSVMYTTPKLAGFTGYIDVILSESNSNGKDVNQEEKGADNAASLALSYEKGGLYLAAAFDKNVAVVESNTSLNDESQVYRLVAQYTLGAWQLGALYDNHDATSYTPSKNADGKDVAPLIVKENQGSAWIISSQYTLGQWALKAQYGQSDILRSSEIERDADVLSLGADYKLSKTTRLFGFYTSETADITWKNGTNTALTGDQSNGYFAFGGELSF